MLFTIIWKKPLEAGKVTYLFLLSTEKPVWKSLRPDEMSSCIISPLKFVLTILLYGILKKRKNFSWLTSASMA